MKVGTGSTDVKGGLDGAKVAFSNGGMMLEVAKRYEWVKSPGAYVYDLEWLSHFCLVPCSFGLPSRFLAAYHLEIGGMPLFNAAGIKFEKCSTTEYKAQVPSIWAKGWMLEVCIQIVRQYE